MSMVKKWYIEGDKQFHWKEIHDRTMLAGLHEVDPNVHDGFQYTWYYPRRQDGNILHVYVDYTVCFGEMTQKNESTQTVRKLLWSLSTDAERTSADTEGCKWLVKVEGEGVLFTSWIQCYACPLLHFSTQRRCHVHCSAVPSFFQFAVPANRFAYLLVTIEREDVLLFCAVYAFPPSVLQRCILQASPYSPLSPQLVATIPSVLSSSCIFFSSGEQLPSNHKLDARWLPESVVVQIFMTLMRLSRSILMRCGSQVSIPTKVLSCFLCPDAKTLFSVYACFCFHL